MYVCAGLQGQPWLSRELRITACICHGFSFGVFQGFRPQPPPTWMFVWLGRLLLRRLRRMSLWRGAAGVTRGWWGRVPLGIAN